MNYTILNQKTVNKISQDLNNFVYENNIQWITNSALRFCVHAVNNYASNLEVRLNQENNSVDICVSGDYVLVEKGLCLYNFPNKILDMNNLYWCGDNRDIGIYLNNWNNLTTVIPWDLRTYSQDLVNKFGAFACVVPYMADANCKKLVNIDYRGFIYNSRNCVNPYLFMNNTTIESIYAFGFDGNVSRMFAGCTNLKQCHLQATTRNLVNQVRDFRANEMFSGCSNLEIVDLSYYNSFEGIKNKSIDKLNTFSGCDKLKMIIVCSNPKTCSIDLDSDSAKSIEKARKQDLKWIDNISNLFSEIDHNIIISAHTVKVEFHPDDWKKHKNDIFRSTLKYSSIINDDEANDLLNKQREIEYNDFDNRLQILSKYAETLSIGQNISALVYSLKELKKQGYDKFLNRFNSLYISTILKSLGEYVNLDVDTQNKVNDMIISANGLCCEELNRNTKLSNIDLESEISAVTNKMDIDRKSNI